VTWYIATHAITRYMQCMYNWVHFVFWHLQKFCADKLFFCLLSWTAM